MTDLGEKLCRYHDEYLAKRNEAMPSDVLEVLADAQTLFRKVYNGDEENVGKAEDPSSLKQLSKGDVVRPIEIIGLSNELGGTLEFDEFKIFIPLVIGRKRWKYADSDSETGCWKLHRRFSGLNKCCTPDGYLSTLKVEEMFRTTCKRMNAVTEEYDITADEEKPRITIEFGYQTLCVTFTPTLFFDGKYVRRSRRPRDPLSVWRQDFFAEEEWCLSRFTDRKLNAKRSLAVVDRLIDDRGSLWPLDTGDLIKTVLLNALNDPERSFDDLGHVISDLLLDFGKSVKSRSLKHYFLKGVNMMSFLDDQQFSNLEKDFDGNAKNIVKLFS